MQLRKLHNLAFLMCLIILTVITASPSNSATEETCVKQVDIASWLISEGAQSYFRVYGQWPGTWADVESSGIVQVQLIAVSGEVVDPDDGMLDFAWDAQYIPPLEGNGPQIGVLMVANGTQTSVTPIAPVLSYADEYANDPDPAVQAALAVESRLKQWAIGGMLQRSILIYKMLKGHQPATFRELVSSGVTGINEVSLNPLTNRVFYGDGRPNDFKFYAWLDEESGEATSNMIFATDEAGNTPWRFSY